ncbi:DUF1616 domain-containing protein [Halosimplex marinum]|uniref:DUF1616 domain-containing protein n=1 Tax=Halosimplex marinum TaxID=3396620 RepID=UPI003F5595A9
MNAGTLRPLVPAPVRSLPSDLAAVLLLTVCADAVVVLSAVFGLSYPRLLAAFALCLALPGYAFVAALFPEREATDGTERRSISGLERAVLSVGLSYALFAAASLVVDLSPAAVASWSVVGAVSLVTVAAVAVAARRRHALDPAARLRPRSPGAVLGRLPTASRRDTVLNAVFAVAVLVALTSVGYALVAPQSGDSVTGFSVLTPGERVPTGQYAPAVDGNRSAVVVGIRNHEHAPTSYTVVVGTGGPGSFDRLETFSSPSLAHGEAWNRTYALPPADPGGRSRATFLLYRGDPPADPSVESAYRRTHVYLNASTA